MCLKNTFILTNPNNPVVVFRLPMVVTFSFVNRGRSNRSSYISSWYLSFNSFTLYFTKKLCIASSLYHRNTIKLLDETMVFIWIQRFNFSVWKMSIFVLFCVQFFCKRQFYMMFDFVHHMSWRFLLHQEFVSSC